MAAKGKDGSPGRQLLKGTTSTSTTARRSTTAATAATTSRRTTRQPPSPSPSEKRVPHYLKPTASSRPDDRNPTRKSPHSVENPKPAGLDRRRSFERPSPAAAALSKPSPPPPAPPSSSRYPTARRTRPPRSLSLSPITPATPSTKKKKKKAVEVKEKGGGGGRPADCISLIPPEYNAGTEGSVWSVEEELSEIESQGVPSDVSILESRDWGQQEMMASVQGDAAGEEEEERMPEPEPPAEGAGEEARESSEREGKKESRVYNEVIEERRSQLLLEEKKNKVKALVGAFETVISLHEPDA